MKLADNKATLSFSNGAPFVFYDGHVSMIAFGTDLTSLLTSSGGEIISGTDY